MDANPLASDSDEQWCEGPLDLDLTHQNGRPWRYRCRQCAVVVFVPDAPEAEDPLWQAAVLHWRHRVPQWPATRYTLEGDGR
jgi:hypothetical protein